MVVEILIFFDTQPVLMYEKLSSTQMFDFFSPNDEAIANNTHRVLVPSLFVSNDSSMKYLQCFHLAFINCVVVWFNISGWIRVAFVAVNSQFPTFGPTNRFLIFDNFVFFSRQICSHFTHVLAIDVAIGFSLVRQNFGSPCCLASGF